MMIQNDTNFKSKTGRLCKQARENIAADYADEEDQCDNSVIKDYLAVALADRYSAYQVAESVKNPEKGK